MNSVVITILLSIGLLFATQDNSRAQSTVFFKVDMSSSIQDSSLIPSQHSVGIKGNQLPFSQIRIIKMHDDNTPKDNIYEKTIHFPSLVNDKILNFRFVIQKGVKKIEETSDRTVILKEREIKLPVFKFNQSNG